MSSKKLSFQQLTDDLESLLAWFESDDITVEEVALKYEQAMGLSAEIESRLNSVQNQIIVIKEKYSDK